MKDRELLEAAAKAAGLSFWWGDAQGRAGNDYMRVGGQVWNPLIDDGDRYRLARQLGLSISFDECTVWKRLDDGSLIQEYWGANDGDEAHAIVRAAAAMESKT